MKYNLGKKSTLNSLEGWKWSETQKWNENKLAVGNWFSENQFYKVNAKYDDHTDVDASIMNEANETYQIPLTQLYDMHSGTMFEREETVTRTELVDIL